MSTHRPENRRPYRAMHANGPEITLTGTPLGPDRPMEFTFRQVGWLGQTGALYDLDEDPRPTEPGSFSPLYFSAHARLAATADKLPRRCPECGRRLRADDDTPSTP